MPNAKIESASPASISRAARLLAEGDLVGVPTETVYGLAANATDPAAVRKIFAAKNRPPNNPLILHVASPQAALAWTDFDDLPELKARWRIATQFWPGPLTCVVPKAACVIDEITSGAPTVAIRVPSHPVMQTLLAECGFPLAAPSANPSNYVSPTTAEHVVTMLGDSVAMVLDGGPCEFGLESSIIRLTESGVDLLRPGGISAERLEAAFGHLNLAQAGKNDNSSEAVMPAPGMMSKHYSPRTPLCRLSNWNRNTHPASVVARICFGPAEPIANESFRWTHCISKDGELGEVARGLYAAMRAADENGCELIVIDECPPEGIGRAIMDRIARAE